MLTHRFTDRELYDRGVNTLVASWQVCADGSAGAVVIREAGIAIGVFAEAPERLFFNNAVFERDLDDATRDAAIDAMEAAYAAAGIDRFAAWAYDGDAPTRSTFEGRGYTVDTSTQVMGMLTSELRAGPSPHVLETGDWQDYLEHLEIEKAPEGLMSGVDPHAFHVVVAREAGQTVAAGLAFDLDGDCGIYNVGTLPGSRRRGLGTAITARLVADARARGCLTATLQSTAMAERVYASVGFRHLGRFIEYVPAKSTPDQ
jgi:GNAT superfamily N-acetyltransferase